MEIDDTVKLEDLWGPGGASRTDAGATSPRTARERNLGMLCHLAALLGVVIPGAILIEILGPLVVWMVHRDELPFVRVQGAESVNFQITMTILYLCCYPLMLVLVGFPLLVAFKIMNLVLVVVAAIRAGRGEDFRYPIALRFVSP